MKVSTYVTNAAFALLYAGVYVLCYVYYLTYHFGYLLYDLNPQPTAFVVLSLFISVIPILCYRGARALSSVLAVFTYVLLYVPIILTFALVSPLPMETVALIDTTFMISMCLLFASDVLLVKNPFDMHTSVDLPRLVFVLALFSTLYLLFVYRGNLRFVAVAEIYEQRAANAALGEGLVTRYVAAWLYTIMIPLCLSYGLIAKKYRYFWLGTASCVTLYMATAAKGAIVLPVVYVGFNALFGNNRLRAIFPLFIGAITITMCLLVVVRDTESAVFSVSTLVLMRTIGSGGLTTEKYYEFFANHPQTSYTHINLVNAVTGGYPYGNLYVGQVVGQYFWAPEMNANANFWATDGLAAIGLPGVLVSTILCVLLFIVINTVTRGYDKLFVVLCFIPFLINFLNASLFSAVWSGGGFFLTLFFLFTRRNTDVIWAGMGGAALRTPAAITTRASVQ